MNEQRRGKLAVMGGMSIHLMLGSFYLWGTISTYVVSYFRKHNSPNLTMSQANIIFPISSCMNCLFNGVGLIISEKFGSRRSILVLSLLNCLSVFISSYTKDYWAFFGFYGVMQAILNGCMYMTPLRIAVRYFPEKKGLVTGCIIGSYGCASLIISFLVVYIINPNNETPIIHSDYYEYSDAVTNNVPLALRAVSYYFIILSLIGSLLLKNKKNFITSIHRRSSLRYLDSLSEDVQNNLKLQQQIQELEQQLINDPDNQDNQMQIILLKSQKVQAINNNNLEDNLLIKKNEQQLNNQLKNDQSQSKWDFIKKVFQTKEVYVLFFMIYCSVLYGYFLASSYKDYGFQKIKDDRFLSLVVGNIASVSNGFSRFLFGYLLDIYGFRKMYFILLIVELSVIITIDLISQNKALYCIWVILSIGCEGGHFVLFPSKTIEIFGLIYGPSVYTIVYYAFCCANLTQTFLIGSLKKIISYQKIFYIFFAITFISLILNILFPLNQKKNLNEKLKKNELQNLETQDDFKKQQN